MDRYRLKVKLGTLDLSSAVCAAINYTNGRNSITQPVCQTYASIPFLKSRLFDLLAPTNAAVEFGSRLDVYVVTGVSTETLLFSGKVTDISSDAETITPTLVDLASYGATSGNVYSWSTYVPNFVTHLWNVIKETTKRTTDYLVTGFPAQFARFTADSTDNGLQYANQIIPSFGPVVVYYDPTRGTDGGRLVIEDRDLYRSGTPTGAFSIDESMIQRDYDIQRSISEVANYVTVSWTDAGNVAQTSIFQNLTSINKIGKRAETVTSSYYSENTIVQFGPWYLGTKAPAGYPVVSVLTSLELLGMDEANAPALLHPSTLVDTSAIDREGFGTLAYIEQVRHQITRSTWKVELLLSEVGYTSTPQIWSKVPTSVKWNTVSNLITWDDLLYTDL